MDDSSTDLGYAGHVVAADEAPMGAIDLGSESVSEFVSGHGED